MVQWVPKHASIHLLKKLNRYAGFNAYIKVASGSGTHEERWGRDRDNRNFNDLTGNITHLASQP